MQRTLLVLVLLEAAAIATLVFLLLSTSAEAHDASLDSSQAPADVEGPSDDLDARGTDDASSQPRAPKEEPGARRVSPETTTKTRPSGTLLLGNIVAPDGSAVPSPTFYIREEKAKRGVSATVNGGGYAVPGLRPGVHAITVRATGYKTYFADFTIESVEQHRVDIELQRARMFTIKLVDENGDPAKHVPGAMSGLGVLATQSEAPASFPLTNMRTISRNGVGRFRMRYMVARELGCPEDCVGVLEVDKPGPFWISVLMRQHVVAKKFVTSNGADKDSPLEIVVTKEAVDASMSSLEVRVVSQETGQPIAGARVSLSDRQSGGGGRPTDAQGHVRLERVLPGLLEFVIRGKGLEGYHANLRIEAGKHFDLGTLRVSKKCAISGRAIDDKGEGVSGAKLEWIVRERYDTVPFDRAMSASTKKEGAFQLYACGRWRYFVRATKDGLVGEAIIDARGGEVKDAVIRMKAARTLRFVSKVPANKIWLVRVLDGGKAVRSFLEHPYGKALDRSIALLPKRYDIQILEDTRVIRAFTIDLRKRDASFRLP